MTTMIPAQEGEKIILTWKKPDDRFETEMFTIRMFVNSEQDPGAWEPVFNPEYSTALVTLPEYLRFEAENKNSRYNDAELMDAGLGIEPHASISIGGNAAGDVLSREEMAIARLELGEKLPPRPESDAPQVGNVFEISADQLP